MHGELACKFVKRTAIRPNLVQDSLERLFLKVELKSLRHFFHAVFQITPQLRVRLWHRRIETTGAKDQRILRALKASGAWKTS